MADFEVQIDASRGAIVVRGEQTFVTEMLEKYRSVFEGMPKQAITPAAGAGEAPNVEKGSGGSGDALADYPNVYDVEGDTVSILVGPPGKSMTAQAQALILLYLYARYKLSSEPTGADLIKEQCRAHACFDPKNFASHLKSQKSLITVIGSNSSLSARLTIPGRKAAEELAKKMQAGE